MSVCICVFCGGGVYTMLLGQERGVWGWKCGPSVIGSEPNVTLCVSLCLCDAEEYKYSPLGVLTHTHTHSFPLQTYELSSQRKKLRIKLCASGLFLRRLQVLNQDFAETTLRWILMQVPHAVGLLHPSWLWTPAFSPTRCFKLTVQTEKWGSPGRKKKHRAPDLAERATRMPISPMTACKIYDSKWMAASANACTTSTRQWMGSERWCPTRRARPYASCPKSPPCFSPETTSSCSPALWRRWRS